jgi:cation:H+ antiporter
VSMAVWGMASAGRVTWQAGLALLSALVINLIWEMRTASEHQDEMEEIDENDRASAPVAGLKLAGGLALLVVGSQILVKGASAAAQGLGVSETVIGLTIVSAGTSMPELVTSLVAAYRGKADLAIGNVVGSNLLNQLVILGVCGLASGSSGLAVDPVMLSRDFPVMVATTLACLPIFWTDGQVSRREGLLLLTLYGLYLVEQVLTEKMAPTPMDDWYRLAVLVVVLPVVMVFLTWQVLRWREQRHARPS